MEYKGKKLLVQGASRGNLGLVKTAKERGIYIVMTGLGGDFPCNPYADKFCYADISDPDAVLRVARDERVDGVIICCSDTGLQAVGRCNDVMGLAGITERAAVVSANKFLMKEALMSAGVRTAKYIKVCQATELEMAIKNIGFPMIVKATDLQGSRGISIVHEKSQLLKAYQDTMSLTKKDYCIIEQFIEGREYGAQAFVYHDEILFVLPHGDETIMCKTAVPVGHYMPYEISEELYADTQKQVTNAIMALGINNCAVNVDLIEKDGKAYIIELTGRVGANSLPELTSNYWGINYYEMILATCLGENPKEVFNQHKEPSTTMARMIKSERSGICKSVSYKEENDVQIHLFIHKGSEVRVFTNSNDAVGEIIVRGQNMDACEKLLNSARSKVIIEFE